MRYQANYCICWYQDSAEFKSGEEGGGGGMVKEVWSETEDQGVKGWGNGDGLGYLIQRGDINTTGTVKYILTFDREDQSQVVVIKGYQTENGVLNASEVT